MQSQDEASRSTGRWAAVAMLLVSVGAALVLSEGLLRVFWQNPYSGEAPDHILKLRIQHPDTDHVFDRERLDPADPTVRLRTDARSYIRPSFQHENPDVTIAFFGGSTMANHAVREELRFHALVAEELGAEGLRVNTLNVARPGGSLHDSLNVLINHVVDDEPDIAVLMHATNDIGLLRSPTRYATRSGHVVDMGDLAKWSAQMLSSRIHLAGLVRKAHGRALSELPNAAAMDRKNDPTRSKAATEPFRARLRAWVHVCRDFGIVPVLMTQPLSSSRNWLTPEWADLGNQDIFNAVTRQVGEEEGVLVIDLVRHLQEQVDGWDEPGRLFFDGMHVNDEGSRVLADFISAALLPISQAQREGRDVSSAQSVAQP